VDIFMGQFVATMPSSGGRSKSKDHAKENHVSQSSRMPIGLQLDGHAILQCQLSLVPLGRSASCVEGGLLSAELLHR
jgi:hypothetical protein